MKVARVGEVVEVEIVPGSFGDGSGIGEDVAPGLVMQDYGESGGDGAGDATDYRHVDAALLQAVERDLAEGVVADAGLKSDAAAECGQVVGNNCRGRREGEHHAVGEEFALGGELLGQAVEDEVEVEFAGDGDVEAGHGEVRMQKSEVRIRLSISDFGP